MSETHIERLTSSGGDSPPNGQVGLLSWPEFWHWTGNRWPLLDETHSAHNMGPAQITRKKLCFYCGLEAHREEWEFSDGGVRIVRKEGSK